MIWKTKAPPILVKQDTSDKFLGAAFLLSYMTAAGYLFWKAFSCRSALCSLIDIPVFAPAGFVFYWAYEIVDKVFGLGSIPNPEVRLPFVIPAVVCNATLYYFLGSKVATLFTTRRR